MQLYYNVLDIWFSSWHEIVQRKRKKNSKLKLINKYRSNRLFQYRNRLSVVPHSFTINMLMAKAFYGFFDVLFFFYVTFFFIRTPLHTEWGMETNWIRFKFSYHFIWIKEKIPFMFVLLWYSYFGSLLVWTRLHLFV